MTNIAHAVIQSKIKNKNVSIGEYAIIRPNVKIGSNVTIHPYVIINSGSIIGNNVEIFPGSIIGREPKGAGAVSRVPVFKKRVLIGSGSSIGSNVVIYYDVCIGKNTLIGDGASIREKCVVGSYSLISRCVTINYNSQIGDHTKIMDSTHITGNSKIGDNVFVSTMVGTANDNLVRQRIYNEHSLKGPVIKNGAFIGLGASILPGIVIGQNAIVAAHSVVTKNVPPKTLVMGVPAKIKNNRC
jgi:acetyltransferase-like isoleucine patch superfamily enzyme